MRTSGALVLSLAGMAAAQVLTEDVAPEKVVGTREFAIYQDNRPCGVFRQDVSALAGGSGFRVMEFLKIVFDGDSTAYTTEMRLDARLGLVEMKRDEGRQRLSLRREGRILVRELSFPGTAKGADLREFDAPQVDVICGVGHFLLLQRSLSKERLDQASFAKIEKTGEIPVTCAWLEDGAGAYWDYVEDVRGIKWHMRVTLDAANQAVELSSPEIPFVFRLKKP